MSESVTAAKAIANQVIEAARPRKYADCVRLTEGPSPVVKLPASLDVATVSRGRLQAAGMSEDQADKFFAP